MNKSENLSRVPWSILIGSTLFLLAFQWVSRHAGAPVVDFVVDDWRLWHIASSCSSLSEAFGQMWNWPDRPLGAGMMMSSYYLLDDNILAYNLLGYFYTALYLLAGVGAVYALSRDWVVAFSYGVIFSVLPNLTESYQWHTMTVSYGLGFAAYLFTVWFWTRFMETGHWVWLGAATGMFFIALFSYEIGILTPAALLVLVPRSHWRRGLIGIAMLGGIVLAYMAWKFTDGFGTSGTLLFPKRQLDMDVAGFIWNAKEVIRWWMGSRLLEAIANGLDGFLSLSRNHMIVLTPVTIIAATASVLLWKRFGNGVSMETAPVSPVRLMIFGLVWFGVVNVITVLAWPGGRMNYLPAFGFSLMLAVIARRLLPSTPGIAAIALITLSMYSNQGTARQWADAGRFNRALFDYLSNTRDIWLDKPVIVVDTREVRDRLTPGLLTPPSRDILVWGHYGNATLIRGAFVYTMTEIIGDYPGEVMLDMEYGIQRDGDDIVGHGWYNQDVIWRRPLTEVYWLDLRNVIALFGERNKHL